MKFLTLFLFAMTLAVLTACEFPFGKDDPVVISVGDTKLRNSDIHRLYPNWDSMDEVVKLSFVERWINEESIYQEAVKQGVLDDTLLQAQMQIAARKIVVDYFIQSFIDTMMVSDAEKLEFYRNHQELYVRGRNMASGAILHFREWPNAESYYSANKSKTFASVPAESNLIKRIERFDSVSVSPDSCILPSLNEIALGKITPIKACGGVLKVAVVTSRLDSADVIPYAEVVADVGEKAWVEHQRVVMDRLKNQWKNSKLIFSKVKVFSEKDK